MAVVDVPLVGDLILNEQKIEKTKLTAWPNDPRRPRMEVARSIWTLRIMASRIVRPVTRSSAKELAPRMRNPSLIIPNTHAPMQAPTRRSFGTRLIETLGKQLDGVPCLQVLGEDEDGDAGV